MNSPSTPIIFSENWKGGSVVSEIWYNPPDSVDISAAAAKTANYYLYITNFIGNMF